MFVIKNNPDDHLHAGIINFLNARLKRIIMKKLFLALSVLLSFSIHAQTVKIAAAANLRYILDEIKVKYAVSHPKVNVVITLGSSGSLFQQISNGADYDIFMAADKSFPDKLKAQGMGTGEVKTYAYGKLVIWSNTVDVSKGIELVTDNSVKKIAIAKPEVAPYGARAIECLKYYNLFDKVKDKIVYADNISQAAQFAQTGNAEIGFLALALALSPEMKGKYIEMDPKSYKPVEQSMVLVKNWKSNPEGAKFMKFVLSAECKPIFEKYGFIVP
jgi:molybdate transport system substrate-binding protein